MVTVINKNILNIIKTLEIIAVQGHHQDSGRLSSLSYFQYVAYFVHVYCHMATQWLP